MKFIKKLPVIVFITFLIVYFYNLVSTGFVFEKSNVLQGEYQGINDIEKKTTLDHRPYYVLKNVKDDIVGKFVLTEEFLPEYQGYRGAINMVIMLNGMDKISYIRVLSHSEDAPQARNIAKDNFLEQFENIDIDYIDSLEKEFDAITGATISSNAVFKYVRTTLEIFSDKDVYIKKKNQSYYIEISILIIVFLLCFILYNVHYKILKYLLLFYSIFFIGYVLKFFINTPMMYYIFTLQIKLFSVIGVIFLLNLFAGLITGENPFCTGVCPFGAIQQILYKISPILCKINEKTKFVFFKYIIFLVLFIFAFTTEDVRYLFIDPFSTAFNLKGTILAWVQLGLIIIGSLLYYRVWCNFLCPAGTFYSCIQQLKYPRMKIILKGKKADILFIVFYIVLLAVSGIYIYENFYLSERAETEIQQGDLKESLMKLNRKQSNRQKSEDNSEEEKKKDQERLKKEDKELKRELQKYEEYGIKPKEAMYYE